MIACLADQANALDLLAQLEHRHPGLPPAQILVALDGAVDLMVEPRALPAWIGALKARRVGDVLQGWLGAHEVVVHELAPDWAVPR